MDDITFGRTGRDTEKWRLHLATAINDVAIPGRSLMSMNALFAVAFAYSSFVLVPLCFTFLQRAAMLSAVLSTAILSVCLSVCPSPAGIASKRLKVG